MAIVASIPLAASILSNSGSFLSEQSGGDTHAREVSTSVSSDNETAARVCMRTYIHRYEGWCRCRGFQSTDLQNTYTSLFLHFSYGRPEPVWVN